MNKEDREEFAEFKEGFAELKDKVTRIAIVLESEYGTKDNPGNTAEALQKMNDKINKIYTTGNKMMCS